MKKKKVKICMNLQCGARENKADAAVCVGCGSSFRGISWAFMSDEEIEKVLHPELVQEEVSQQDAVYEDASEDGERLGECASSCRVIICPSCGVHIPYRVGLEFCECGEYVQEEIPVEEGSSEGEEKLRSDEKQEGCVSQEQLSGCIKGMTTLDGTYRLEFTDTWMKIGREAVGRGYFESAGKLKVSREHAIIQLVNGEWHLSYCKKEDRNYAGGAENPIFINGRRMDRLESYRLQAGDEIAFAELDKSDPMAAFFRVE